MNIRIKLSSQYYFEMRYSFYQSCSQNNSNFLWSKSTFRVIFISLLLVKYVADVNQTFIISNCQFIYFSDEKVKISFISDFCDQNCHCCAFQCLHNSMRHKTLRINNVLQVLHNKASN